MSVRATPGKVNLAFLRKVGVAQDDVKELQESIHKSNDLAIDAFGRVSFRTLVDRAKTLGIDLPPNFNALVSPSTEKAERIPLKLENFPKPVISAGDVRSHDENMGPVMVDTKVLGQQPALQEFLNSIAKKDEEPLDLSKGVDAGQLAELLQSRRGHAGQFMTQGGLDNLLVKLYSVRGPKYQERDATVNLDSTFDLLHSGSGRADGVRIHKRSMYEHLFVQRNANGKSFDLHGFKGEKLAVTMPKGFSAVIVDAEGDQRAVRVPTTRMKIDGEVQTVLELTPESVRSFGPNHAKRNDFTLRILDANNDPVMEKHLEFNGQVGENSEKLATFEFGYPGKPATEVAELSDTHFNHFVPTPKSNPTPAGLRPAFAIDDGPACDQVVIQRDGKSFALNSWMQFGAPPKNRPQLVRDKQKKGGVRLTRSNRSQNHLDHPDYDPMRTVKVQDTFGHNAVFDRALSQTAQLRWDFNGLHLMRPGSLQDVASFDPLNRL